MEEKNVEVKENMSEFTENYFLEFSRVMQNVWANPFILNQFLKDSNMSAVANRRMELLRALENPRDNERILRAISRYLYMVQLPYKRMLHYLSDILTFDYYVIPINAKEEDFSKRNFKLDYNKALDWFDLFDVKSEFKKALLKMSMEDGYFTYLRKDYDGKMFLQELPADWCMIDNTWKNGYLFSFDMTHFQRMGADLDGYAPDFKDIYNATVALQQDKNAFHPDLRPEFRNGQWSYWYQLKPENAWVFKFHDIFAALVPPLLGVFLDLVDIPAYKELQKAKSELEAYKIIMGTIPRNKSEGRTGTQKDDFAISAESLARFAQLVKNSFLNKYIDFKAVPVENLELFTFEDAVNKEDVLSKTLDNIFSQTGIDKSGFNTDRPSVATLNLSKLIDAAFIARLYTQFANFCEYHINQQTGKYKFKVIMEGTIYDRQDRIDRYMSYADKGIVLLPQLASAIGMNAKDVMTSLTLTKSLGFMDKLNIMPTVYTQSAKDSSIGGRPAKDDDELSEVGEQTRNIGANENKEGG